MGRFNDSITIPEIAAGIEATVANTAGLVDSARSLIAAECFGPAFGIALMSLEEVGKLHSLRAMIQRGALPGTKWSKLWGAFRSHVYKSSAGLMDTYSDDFRADPETIVELATAHEGTSGEVEGARQWSFYVDFDPKTRTWNLPVEFEEERARDALELAEAALQRARNHLDAGMFSIDALELLREIYEPFFGELFAKEESVSAIDIARCAIPYHREWYERMVADGILDPTSGVELILKPPD